MIYRTGPNNSRQHTQNAQHAPPAANPLDTSFFDSDKRSPEQPHAPPEGNFSRWLSVEDIRKMQRMRRSTVIDAMNAGELPFERRGRVRYARLSDVLVWEERRLQGSAGPSERPIDPDLLDLLG